MQNLHWYSAHGACMTKPSHISLASCKVAQLKHTYITISVVHAKNQKMVKKQRAQLQLQNVANYSSDQFHAIKDLCWILTMHQKKLSAKSGLFMFALPTLHSTLWIVFASLSTALITYVLPNNGPTIISLRFAALDRTLRECQCGPLAKLYIIIQRMCMHNCINTL